MSPAVAESDRRVTRELSRVSSSFTEPSSSLTHRVKPRPSRLVAAQGPAHSASGVRVSTPSNLLPTQSRVVPRGCDHLIDYRRPSRSSSANISPIPRGSVNFPTLRSSFRRAPRSALRFPPPFRPSKHHQAQAKAFLSCWLSSFIGPTSPQPVGPSSLAPSFARCSSRRVAPRRSSRAASRSRLSSQAFSHPRTKVSSVEEGPSFAIGCAVVLLSVVEDVLCAGRIVSRRAGESPLNQARSFQEIRGPHYQRTDVTFWVLHPVFFKDPSLHLAYTFGPIFIDLDEIKKTLANRDLRAHLRSNSSSSLRLSRTSSALFSSIPSIDLRWYSNRHWVTTPLLQRDLHGKTVVLGQVAA